MDRRDRLAAVLAVGVVVVRVRAHRTGPVQREDGRDVLEVVGLHRAQQRAHGPAVELEHAERVAARRAARRSRWSSSARSSSTERLAAVGLDVVEGVVDDREVAQPQEVHLDQAERLARRVVELRDDRAVLLALHDRDDVDERLARHDDAGGVHAPLALEVLEPERRVDDRLASGSVSYELPDLAGLFVARVRRCRRCPPSGMSLPMHGRRHHLGELLAHARTGSRARGRVLDRLLGLDRAVGHDLRDALVAVLLGDVADDLAATTLVEVDVDVGHRHAFGVEEPLEQQTVLERVEVGDARGRTRRSSRRPNHVPGRRGCRAPSPSLMKSATTRK